MEPRAPLPPSDLPDAPDRAAAGPDGVTPDDPLEATAAGLPDLSSLPIAGINRRRLTFLMAAICAAWIVIVFARQVGVAAAASARLEAVRAHNAELARELAALEAEYELIQGDAYVTQQGHAYRLGRPGEIAVTRARPVELPADAPGSASLRLGAPEAPPSPLESWLSLLFGPSR